MRRREFIAGVGGVAAWPLSTSAQPKMPVIGFLSSNASGTVTTQLTGFRQGLSEVGFVEGKNLIIEYRSPENSYDQLPELAADLVRARVDVIVAQAPPAARAAKNATTTIPIVFAVGTDPVVEGLVASFARPGGNMTGFTLLFAGLSAKLLSLLAEVVPQARRFAVLVNPSNPNPWISEMQEAANAKGAELLVLKAATAPQIDVAFEAIVKQRCDAIVVGEDTFLYQRRKQMADLASLHRIPAIGTLRGFADVGGLISYGSSLQGVYREVGLYAGQILKGAKPADLPVQQPTKFEMIINLKTAKEMNLVVPTFLLARADEVIE